MTARAVLLCPRCGAVTTRTGRHADDGRELRRCAGGHESTDREEVGAVPVLHPSAPAGGSGDAQVG